MTEPEVTPQKSTATGPAERERLIAGIERLSALAQRHADERQALRQAAEHARIERQVEREERAARERSDAAAAAAALQAAHQALELTRIECDRLRGENAALASVTLTLRSEVASLTGEKVALMASLAAGMLALRTSRDALCLECVALRDDLSGERARREAADRRLGTLTVGTGSLALPAALWLARSVHRLAFWDRPSRRRKG